MNEIIYMVLKEGFAIGFSAGRAYVEGFTINNPTAQAQEILDALTASDTGVDDFVEKRLRELARKLEDDVQRALH